MTDGVVYKNETDTNEVASTIEIPKELARDLVISEVDVEGYSHVYTTPFVGDGKYQYQRVIIVDESNKQLYFYSVTRSGSYFTEYNYDYGDLDYKDSVTFKHMARNDYLSTRLTFHSDARYALVEATRKATTILSVTREETAWKNVSEVNEFFNKYNEYLREFFEYSIVGWRDD